MLSSNYFKTERGYIMNEIVKTTGLTKRYRGAAAVNNLNMSVREGRIYGFLGPNGAGKTTTLKMLLGLVRPTAGEIEITGRRVRAKNRVEILRDIGSLIESPSFYGHLTGEENLRILQTLLDVPRRNIDRVLQIVRLDGQRGKKASAYSLGMKQRLGIALALVGDPEFIILDEPINGLDPTGIVEVRELLLKLKNDFGKTVFISSHILGELEKIATSYGIISRGKLVEEITAEELEKKCRGSTVLKTNNSEKSLKIIKDNLGIVNTEAKADGSIVIWDTVENIGMLTNELFENGITVSGISTSDNGVESYFIKKMEEG